MNIKLDPPLKVETNDGTALIKRIKADPEFVSIIYVSGKGIRDTLSSYSEEKKVTKQVNKLLKPLLKKHLKRSIRKITWAHDSAQPANSWTFDISFW